MLRASSVSELADHGLERIVVTCGVFDGVHRGHQRIIRRLLEMAARHDATPVMATFDPHPAAVIPAQAAPPLLVSLEHRLCLAADCGIAAAVVLPFTRDLSSLRPRDFLDEHLAPGRPTVCGICVGEHWRFGHQARGDVGVLTDWGAARAIEIQGVSLEVIDGTIVSSSGLRDAVAAGDLQRLQRCLGRPYSIMGPVVHGKGLATKALHYPTANISPAAEVFPPKGIYAANGVFRDDDCRISERLPGVVYFGDAPSMVAEAPAIPFLELHLFDFAGDIYGQRLEAEFLSLIRGDQAFPSIDALAEQIAKDIAVARAFHGLD